MKSAYVQRFMRQGLFDAKSREKSMHSNRDISLESIDVIARAIMDKGTANMLLKALPQRIKDARGLDVYKMTDLLNKRPIDNLRIGFMYNSRTKFKNVFRGVWKEHSETEKRLFLEKLPIYILKHMEFHFDYKIHRNSSAKWYNKEIITNYAMQRQKTYKDKMNKERTVSLALLKSGGRSALNAYRSRHPVVPMKNPQTKLVLKKIAAATRNDQLNMIKVNHNLNLEGTEWWSKERYDRQYKNGKVKKMRGSA